MTVRSFAWLYKACQDCVERWQKRQNTLQMYQTFHEQRSRSGSQSCERDRHPGAPGVVRRYDPLARKSDPSPSRSVRSGRDGRPDGKPRSSSPGRSSQRDRASPGRGSQRDKRTPSPKSPRRQSPAGPADRSCWEYAKTGKCQHGRDCRFEHDKSPRNPAAPSTPRTGDRPVRDKPMYFGYCYDWMYGKCTAQPCKYLHQKPLPGTKPIAPRTTAGPVVEDEEGDTPRSPTPSPPDREASPAQGLTDFWAGRAVTLRPTVLLWRVQLCGLLPQLPVGLLPPCVSTCEAHCSSPAIPVEVLNGTKSFGDGQLTQMGR